MKPSDDPKADELKNSNISESKQEAQEQLDVVDEEIKENDKGGENQNG